MRRAIMDEAVWETEGPPRAAEASSRLVPCTLHQEDHARNEDGRGEDQAFVEAMRTVHRWCEEHGGGQDEDTASDAIHDQCYH